MRDGVVKNQNMKVLEGRENETFFYKRMVSIERVIEASFHAEGGNIGAELDSAKLELLMSSVAISLTNLTRS